MDKNNIKAIIDSYKSNPKKFINKLKEANKENNILYLHKIWIIFCSSLDIDSQVNEINDPKFEDINSLKLDLSEHFNINLH